MRKYDRLGTRYRRVFLFVIVFIIAAIGIGLGLARQNLSRFTVAIATDPVLIWSWDSQRRTSVIVEIPASTVVNAVGGYGRYSLTSLWKLGDLDSKDAGVFPQTLAGTVGLPIPWYIGGGVTESITYAEPIAAIRNIFSLGNIATFLRGGFRTNMNALVFFQFLNLAYASKNEQTTMVNLTHSPVLVNEGLPDSSQIHTIDPGGLDSLIGQAFEDGQIRREALSVAVYNTTQIPTLGFRFSRILTHLGAKVTFVGNSLTSVLGICELRGKKDMLDTYTARSLQKQLRCGEGKLEGNEGERFDIAIFVGEGYAKLWEGQKH